MHLSIFILLAYVTPMILLTLRYLFKVRLFSLFLFLYTLVFWSYYVSANEVIIINEISTTQLPLMPLFPILHILIFASFSIIDFVRVMVE